MSDPVLRVTDQARQRVLDIRSNEPEPEKLALWIEVNGVAGGNYTYDMWFQPLADATANDLVHRHDDLSVVVPEASVDKIRGATLDLSGDPAQPGGMVIVNPNRPPAPTAAAGAPSGDLSSEVAQRVMEVLEHQINPSIAAHGGHAELVAVDDGTAYLRLSGGCQGCGLASVTLTQGIEVAIRDEVPEITQVVDVTDHASGTNPYFESAKK